MLFYKTTNMMNVVSNNEFRELKYSYFIYLFKPKL
jgi:hypothetical protein